MNGSVKNSKYSRHNFKTTHRSAFLALGLLLNGPRNAVTNCSFFDVCFFVFVFFLNQIWKSITKHERGLSLAITVLTPPSSTLEAIIILNETKNLFFEARETPRAEIQPVVTGLEGETRHAYSRSEVL